jgi:hypothetical protein
MSKIYMKTSWQETEIYIHQNIEIDFLYKWYMTDVVQELKQDSNVRVPYSLKILGTFIELCFCNSKQGIHYKIYY